jgi:hypothetical protein
MSVERRTSLDTAQVRRLSKVYEGVLGVEATPLGGGRAEPFTICVARGLFGSLECKIYCAAIASCRCRISKFQFVRSERGDDAFWGTES